MLLSTISSYLLLCTIAPSAISQNTGTLDPAQPGWIPDSPTTPETPSHWLRQNGRVAIIIVLGSVILGLLIWYIVRSVKGMRKRLREENEKHFLMFQQLSSAPPGQATTVHSTAEHSPTPPDSAHQSSVLPLKHSSTLYQTAVDIQPSNPSSGQQQQQQHHY
ncbi:hypothetical protein BX666DRAFT_2023487 [Dichotomocladium elegans]|nr:hypothetical protein BX666DRAFT_2023487 [Dichotomocladium elegans]